MSIIGKAAADTIFPLLFSQGLILLNLMASDPVDIDRIIEVVLDDRTRGAPSLLLPLFLFLFLPGILLLLLRGADGFSLLLLR